MSKSPNDKVEPEETEAKTFKCSQCSETMRESSMFFGGTARTCLCCNRLEEYDDDGVLTRVTKGKKV